MGKVATLISHTGPGKIWGQMKKTLSSGNFLTVIYSTTLPHQHIIKYIIISALNGAKLYPANENTSLPSNVSLLTTQEFRSRTLSEQTNYFNKAHIAKEALVRLPW